MGRQVLDILNWTSLFPNPGLAVPADVQPMVPGFLKRRRADAVELQRLLTARDFTGVGYIAHRLKGSGGGFGFPVISEIGRELEAAAVTGDVVTIQEFLEHLNNVVGALSRQYDV